MRPFSICPSSRILEAHNLLKILLQRKNLSCEQEFILVHTSEPRVAGGSSAAAHMGTVRAAGWVLLVVFSFEIPCWNAEGFARGLGEAPAAGEPGSRHPAHDGGADAVGLSPGAWLFLDGDPSPAPGPLQHIPLALPKSPS